MTKILNFAIKIFVIYFQISFCDRKDWKTTSESKIKNENYKIKYCIFWSCVKNDEFNL